LSLAVIVALYFSRRSQIQKLQVTLDDQDIAVAEEAKSEAAVEPVGAEAEPREEEYVAEEASDIDEEYSESETDEESIYITDEEYSEDDEA
ncbi:MAG: hypothetical protein ACFFAX_11345, partial [Promethearchaeota archaeon]